MTTETNETSAPSVDIATITIADRVRRSTTKDDFYLALLAAIQRQAATIGLSFVKSEPSPAPTVPPSSRARRRLARAPLCARLRHLYPRMSKAIRRRSLAKDCRDGFGAAWLDDILTHLARHGIRLQGTEKLPPRRRREVSMTVGTILRDGHRPAPPDNGRLSSLAELPEVISADIARRQAASKTEQEAEERGRRWRVSPAGLAQVLGTVVHAAAQDMRDEAAREHDEAARRSCARAAAARFLDGDPDLTVEIVTRSYSFRFGNGVDDVVPLGWLVDDVTELEPLVRRVLAELARRNAVEWDAVEAAARNIESVGARPGDVIPPRPSPETTAEPAD